MVCFVSLKLKDRALCMCAIQFWVIPSGDRPRDSFSFNGLGYCAVTGRYKVIQTFQPNPESDYHEAHVYTIGKGSSRRIENATNKPIGLPFNSFLHGALHWTNLCENSTEFIYSFNFETEKFGVIPDPSFFVPFQRRCAHILSIGVLEGYLFLCSHGDDSSKFEIWVMREYGVQESWMKRLLVDGLRLNPRGMCSIVYESMLFLGTGEILMAYLNEVYCYNPKTHCLSSIQTPRTQFDIDFFAHTPSFVSLYNVGMGEQVKRVLKSSKYKKLSAEGNNKPAGRRMQPARACKI